MAEEAPPPLTGSADERKSFGELRDRAYDRAWRALTLGNLDGARFAFLEVEAVARQELAALEAADALAPRILEHVETSRHRREQIGALRELVDLNPELGALLVAVAAHSGDAALRAASYLRHRVGQAGRCIDDHERRVALELELVDLFDAGVSRLLGDEEDADRVTP